MGGDSLYSRQPIIEEVLSNRMHYIFVAKTTDHKTMMNWLSENPPHEIRKKDEKGRTLLYQWKNDAPLNARVDAIKVNYFKFQILTEDKDGNEKINYSSSWVTDLAVTENNVETFVAGGRCRWKVENECFNFYLFTLLAFYFHQIFELTDGLYQQARVKFGSKRNMWQKLSGYIAVIVFETWEQLLDFGIDPDQYSVQLQRHPP